MSLGLTVWFRPVFPDIVPTVPIDLVSGGMAYVAFLGSTSCHEAAHAWAALRLGDDTAARGGQATLDPTPHVRRDPIGMVVVPLVSFVAGGAMIGWASAPYDREWARNFPRRAAAMSFAGPAANLLLVILAAALIRAGVGVGVFESPGNPGWDRVTAAVGGGFWPFLAGMLSLTFSLNLLLGLFNLLPLPPLDGAALPLLFLPPRAAAGWIEWRGAIGFVGLFAAWKVSDLFFPPFWQGARQLLLGSGS